ncbi:MAG: hypothetical protein H7844_03165 [Nitrospirae bacterium YQR-1]
MGMFVEQDITYTKEDIHRLIGIFGENVVHKMRKANLEAEIHEITKELEYYRERIERSELKNSEAEKSLKEHNDLSSEMTEQISHLKKEKEHLEREIEKFANIEQKAAELIDRDALIFSLKKEVAVSEGKAKHLQKSHEKIVEEKNRSESMVTEAQKKLDNLTDETKKLSETLAFQKSVIPPYKDLNELQRYKDEAQGEIAGLKRAIENVNKEIAKSTETLSARTAQSDKAHNERQSLTAKKEELEREIAEITGYESVEELQKIVSELQSGKESLTAALHALESTKTESEGKIKKTEIQIKEEGVFAAGFEKTVNDHALKREEVRTLKEEVSLRELEIGVTERLTQFSVPIEEFLKLNHKALKSISDKYEMSLENLKNALAGGIL